MCNINQDKSRSDRHCNVVEHYHTQKKTSVNIGLKKARVLLMLICQF